MKKIVMYVMGFVLLTVTNVYSKSYIAAIPELSYFPYYEKTAAGEIRGFIPEMIRKFSRDTKLDIKMVVQPIKRYYHNLFERKIDFVIPDTENWTTDLKKGHPVVYSQSFLTTIDGLLVKTEKKDAGIEVIGKVGSPIGFTPWAIIDRVKSEKIRVSHNPSQKGLLLQVIKGRIDAAFMCVSVGMYYTRKEINNNGALAFAYNMPYSRDKLKLSTIKHPDIIQQFDRWLEENDVWITNKKKVMSLELGENVIRQQKEKSEN